MFFMRLEDKGQLRRLKGGVVDEEDIGGEGEKEVEVASKK